MDKDKINKISNNTTDSVDKNVPWTPLKTLHPYQLSFVKDQAQFKILLGARQIGKSMMLAVESTMDCCFNENSTWLYISASLRQGQEWLSEKALKWSELWSETFAVNGFDVKVVKATQSEISFSNGSRIIVLPANPDTIRGYSANVILDEFAFMEHDKEIWAAVWPSVSSGHMGRELKVRISSTVSGKNTKFWDLLDSADKPEKQGHWSKYVIDIHKAVEGGLKVDVEKLHSEADNEETWQREYLCKPVDESATLLPSEVIGFCESDSAQKDLHSEELGQPGMNYAIGIDVGRSKDLTVLWFLRIEGSGLLRTVGVVELPHMELNFQQNVIADYLKHNSIRKCYIDSTGIGRQMGEYLARQFGSTVTAFNFTESSKRELFINMQATFYSRRIVVPKDTVLHDDLNSVQKVVNSSGKISFRAPRNADGHADRATACALAIMAASKGEVRAMAQAVDAFECDRELRALGLRPGDADRLRTVGPTGWLWKDDPRWADVAALLGHPIEFI